MGRVKDDAVVGGMAKRLASGREEAPPEQVAAAPQELAPTKPKKAPARADKDFVGFYVSKELNEKLRVLAFETRRQRQDLMTEALGLLFKKHG